MSRKIKRNKNYELTLEIRSDDFVRPPREAQRNWVLNRFLKEAGEDLEALDQVVKTFVPGGEPADLSERTNSTLQDNEIMEDWQIVVMDEMAKEVCAAHGDVLEIGYGRGIASEFIQERGVRSHTIVECNDEIIKRFEIWRATKPQSDIRLISGKWQDTVDQLGSYDGVFFHTYPLNEEEFVRYVAQSSTFAEHFMDTAAAHLNAGGIFSYLTNEIDSLSRAHQRALLRRFRSFTLRILGGLGVPADTRDAHWAQQTVIVRAEK
jgi:guanidinoacetate N-methyltransferase